MNMTCRTVIRVTIELHGPWLVGDPSGTGDIDTAPLREPDGSVQVPATSLAGSLRDHLRGWPGVDYLEWLGDRPGQDDQRGRPSRLRVLGVVTAGGERSARRTSTAVDPRAGSARRASLRREEYVDAPTRLTVYLMHEGEPEPLLRDALAGWQPLLGRRRTNGWGRATVTEVRYGRADLRDRGQLEAWLSGGGPSLIDALATVPVTPVTPPPEADLLSIRCAVVDGLHIGTGERVEALDPTGEAGQAVAGTFTHRGNGCVPASSWRGVFRAHAGFILRGLGLSDNRTRQLVAELFGSAERRGLLTFHDSTLEALAELDLRHVGIDRITGGARPGLLFAERVVRGTLRLWVSAACPDRVPDWGVSLLRHTVRDIADGFLAVGGRTTRGLGTLAVLDPVPNADGIDIGPLAGDPDPSEEGSG
jgi:CRISPR/Cas system CSM-associated protein Csm3 (group 7 of RAMP superfamily)